MSLLFAFRRFLPRFRIGESTVRASACDKEKKTHTKKQTKLSYSEIANILMPNQEVEVAPGWGEGGRG